MEDLQRTLMICITTACIFAGLAMGLISLVNGIVTQVNETNLLIHKIPNKEINKYIHT